MSLKLIGTILGDPDTQKGRTVRIYRDIELGEFRVRLFVEGKLQEPADYFTDDKGDAWDTGMATLVPTLR